MTADSHSSSCSSSSPTSLVIRPALPQDASSIASSLILSFQESYTSFYSSEFLAALPNNEYFTEARALHQLSLPDRITIVACKSGQSGEEVVGFARASREADKDGYKTLYSIYLIREWSGMGFGRRLVERALGGQNVKAYVECIAANEPASVRNRLVFSRMSSGGIR